MTVSECLVKGYLNRAIVMQIEAVKNNPDNSEKRILLLQLLCIDGQYERAELQIRVLLKLQPELAQGLLRWQRIIASAYHRNKVYQGSATPKLLHNLTDSIRYSLDVLKKNQVDPSRIEKYILDYPFIDSDDINVNILEVMLFNGDYCWVDYNYIDKLILNKPYNLLEKYWLEAEMEIQSGQILSIVVPAIYPLANRDNYKLGLKTDWEYDKDIHRGKGLRMLLMGDELVSIYDLANGHVLQFPKTKDYNKSPALNSF